MITFFIHLSEMQFLFPKNLLYYHVHNNDSYTFSNVSINHVFIGNSSARLYYVFYVARLISVTARASVESTLHESRTILVSVVRKGLRLVQKYADKNI